MTTFTDQIREVISPWKFGNSRRATALHLASLDGMQDEDTGDVDWGIWVARFGRNLFYVGSDGFVSTEKFRSEDAARAEFQRIEAKYAEVPSC